MVLRDEHIYMPITFSDFLNYLRTVSNPPYIIIWLITKYLPSLNNCVTSMKDCEQTDSTKETVNAQLSRKWTLVLTYLLGIASYNLHCSWRVLLASVESLHLGCAYNCVDTKAKSRATTKTVKITKELRGSHLIKLWFFSCSINRFHLFIDFIAITTIQS